MITDQDRLIAKKVVAVMSDYNIQTSIEDYLRDGPDTMDEHDHLLLAEDYAEKERREKAGTWNPVEPKPFVDLIKEFPRGEDEGEYPYTNRLLRIGQERGYLRQCSIGWHDECSDRRSNEGMCSCPCHEAY